MPSCLKIARRFSTPRSLLRFQRYSTTGSAGGTNGQAGVHSGCSPGRCRTLLVWVLGSEANTFAKSSLFPWLCARTGGSVHPHQSCPREGAWNLCGRLMKGDHCIGRGLRERNLQSSVFGNPFKVAIHGRAEAIRRCENVLRKNDELLKMLPQLSGTRLVCHRRADQLWSRQ